MNGKYYYQCTNCKAEYRTDEIIYLCPVCSKENRDDQPAKGILKVLFDYDGIRKRLPSGDLIDALKDENFLSLLPLHDFTNWPKLRIGNTPLYNFDISDSSKTGFELYLKDDSQNPTFSFKDRASALISAWAKENKIWTIITASTGNAGSSLAGISASQGQKSYIFVPASAPLAKLTQIVMYGATLVAVNGTYDQAFDLSVKASELFGFYNRNTAFNPLTIEGKKTVSFEIFDQLNNRVPDYIFIPVGDGVILSGVYKGFEDLMKLGIISKMPVMVSVQAEGSNNLVANISTDHFISRPSKTIADSISVDIPRNFYMSVDYIKTYKGQYITVSDEEIIRGSIRLSRSTGIFSEPAAAAAFAGMMKYQDTNKIPAGSKVVVMLTGSGLKDLKSVQSSIRLPSPIEPVVHLLKQIFN